jgi:hypothetical protein
MRAIPRHLLAGCLVSVASVFSLPSFRPPPASHSMPAQPGKGAPAPPEGRPGRILPPETPPGTHHSRPASPTVESTGGRVSEKPTLGTDGRGEGRPREGRFDERWQTGQSGNKRSLPALPGLPPDAAIPVETRCKNVKKQDLLTTKRIDSLSEYKVSTRPLLISPSPIQALLSFPGHRHPSLPSLVTGLTGASGRGKRWFSV